MSPLQVAFIGLGALGQPVAGHISDHLENQNLPSLLVYNRTAQVAHDFKQTKPAVTVIDSLQEIGKKADVIFLCVLNNEAAIAVTDALIPHIKPDTVIVDHSTLTPSTATEIHQNVQKVGAHYLSAPVMGPPEMARTGNLIVLLSGASREARDKVLPLMIPVIGKKTVDLGTEEVENALRLKLCGNFFVAGIVEMISEGMQLGEKTGLGQENIASLLNSLFPGTIFGVYANRIMKKSYLTETAFSINGMKKDVSYIKDMAAKSDASIPIVDVFKSHIDQCDGERDITSIVEGKRE
ncbi:NAD(P)-binding protein [Backusella circina FSU 941]|nr:NAD(P)-binding protein [Backusella circina FSU 941]